ncbi:sigma factor [Streptomyces sp. NPDC059389]|uniref:sigma factor n=1 Tax=Streptomyces sp. NPDC059389 TaxID=3346818 RepID=UPI0036773BB1
MIAQDPAALADFEEHRPRMFGIAYRMLGSAAEAQDTVQDAWLRWSSAGREGIEHPGAWLTKVVAHLCLYRLASARARREEYVGPWLPEPVLTGGGALGPLESAEQRDGVSMALLVLLERLTPVERAVYVLREAFAYGHREAEVNGEPALLVGGGAVLQVGLEDGLVRGVRSVVNPEKLEFLQRQLSHSRGLSGPGW